MSDLQDKLAAIARTWRERGEHCKAAAMNLKREGKYKVSNIMWAEGATFIECAGLLEKQSAAILVVNAELEREGAEYQAAKARVHKSFGFVPNPADLNKCNCAYCARDFEAVAEHAALMEMELFRRRRPPSDLPL